MYILESLKFIENVSKLLETQPAKLSELLTTRTVNASNKNKKRDTIYQTPCLQKEECEERLHCLMRFLYVSLFRWIVKKINETIYNDGDYKTLGKFQYFPLNLSVVC